jgi:hypothetical protein
LLFSFLSMHHELVHGRSQELQDRSKFKNNSSKTCNGIPHYQYSCRVNKSIICM